ncbi:hypothetical protein [Adlercreutzia sp. ZJ141]|uniref:hypothetical protein n=1 Tax=Adlercreutzia sp. ZJ141 TaxID=2709406 RepID=UPI0013EA8129|nr:hypothetical protein [Adlercreutzia sp. ZJ141]
MVDSETTNGMISLDEFAKSMRITAPVRDESHSWGTVGGLPSGGRCKVRLDGATVDVDCVLCCDVSNGDRVIVLTMASGESAVIARVRS